MTRLECVGRVALSALGSVGRRVGRRCVCLGWVGRSLCSAVCVRWAGAQRSARQFRPVNFSFEQNIQTSSWRVGRLCFFCSHRLPAVHGVEKRRPRSQVRGRRVVVRPSAGEAGAALADSAEDDPHGSASNEGVTRTHRNKRRARRSETARIHTLQYDKSSKDCISETCKGYEPLETQAIQTARCRASLVTLHTLPATWQQSPSTVAM